MTYSSAWIQSDDSDFEFLNRVFTMDPRDGDLREKVFRLPPTPLAGHYWINIVKDWGKANGVEVEYTTYNAVEGTTSKAMVVKFLADTFHKADAASQIYAKAKELFADEGVYRICADEF